MADISKIKLPDGVTYNVKDTNAARTSHTQKADTISGGYLFTHPESSINATIIPFINNDIAWLLKRGGSAVVKYDGVTQSVDISNLFDGSPSYLVVDNRNITTIVIELTLYGVFAWTNMAYCDFGSPAWRAKSIKIEVMNTNYASDVWTTKLDITNNSIGYATADVSHTPVGASSAGGGFNKIRFTFTDWAGIGTSNFRVAQLGIVNFNGFGLREPYMSRGGDDAVWRNITPASNNSYNLGAVSYKWANGYFTNINGVSVGDSPKFTDNNTTYTLSANGNNIVLTPSSGSANTITVPYATNAGSATDSTKLPLAGGTMTGALTPNGGINFTATGLPQFAGSPPFYIGIEAFNDGGQVKWKQASDCSVGYANSAGNAGTVNNLTVQTAVPANAVFTDTKVTQTAITGSDEGEYYILMSPKNSSSTETNTATKFKGLYFYHGSFVVGDGEYGDETYIDDNSIRTKYLQADERVYTSNVICNDITCGKTIHNITLPHQYSETEQVVGYWIDNSPIYEKTIQLSSIITIASNSNTAISKSYWSQTAKPIDFKVYRMTQASYQVGICTIAVIDANGKLTIYNTRQGSLAFDAFTIQYIKT